MSELEEKLGTILSNPQLMQQISAMAQALGQAPPEPPAPPSSSCFAPWAWGTRSSATGRGPSAPGAPT